MTPPFAIGDPIEHPVHGRGTITFVGAEYIGIVFDDGRNALLKRERLQSDLLSDRGSSEAPHAPTEPAPPWPHNTFFPDDNAGRHAMGSHWQPFAEEAADILHKLPEWLPEMQRFVAYGDLYRSPRPNPDDWAQGFSLCWPDGHGGLIVVAKANAEENEIVSLFPCFERGLEVRLTVVEVTVWEGGLEAQIRAEWGDTVVDFFDAQAQHERLAIVSADPALDAYGVERIW